MTLCDATCVAGWQRVGLEEVSKFRMDQFFFFFFFLNDGSDLQIFLA
jgi:hypothetical protein